MFTRMMIHSTTTIGLTHNHHDPHRVAKTTSKPDKSIPTTTCAVIDCFLRSVLTIL